MTTRADRWAEYENRRRATAYATALQAWEAIDRLLPEPDRPAHWAQRPVPPVLVTAADVPRGFGPALRAAFLGRPEHSRVRHVLQPVLVGMFLLGVVGTITDPETTPTASRTVDTPTPTTAPPAPAPAPTVVPTTSRPTPTPTSASPAPVEKATVTRVVTPTPRPVRTTTRAPKPVAPSTCGAPANPWGYNFCGRGSVISNPPASFCDVFDCIASFWESTNGYVMQCEDLMFSHSGGRSGSCSHHGGNYRALTG